jgi:hypothetical protein
MELKVEIQWRSEGRQREMKRKFKTLKAKNADEDKKCRLG